MSAPAIQLRQQAALVRSLNRSSALAAPRVPSARNRLIAQGRCEVLALAQQTDYIELISAFEAAPEQRELRHPPDAKASRDDMRCATDRIDMRQGGTVNCPEMEHDEPCMAHFGPGRSGEIVWTFNRAGDFDFAAVAEPGWRVVMPRGRSRSRAPTAVRASDRPHSR